MKLTPREEFELLYPKFKSRELEVPAKTREKMLFISGRVLGKPSPHSFPNLPQQEMSELSTLDPNSLAIFFNILVKTLLLEREPTECECRVKFSGFFQSWRAARIGVREGFMQVKTENKQTQLQLRRLGLFNCRNSKRSFQVHRDGKLIFEAKFQTDSAFKHACSWLGDAVESSKTQPKVEKRPKEELSLVPSEKKQRTPESSLDNSPVNRESSAQEMLKDEKPPGFKVVEQSPQFLLCCAEEGQIYGSVIMTSRASLETIVNYYIQMHQWNSAIIDQKINHVPGSQNTFSSVKRIKHDSIFSNEWTLQTSISVNCSKNIATIQQEEEGSQKTSYSLRTRCYRCLGGVKLIVEGRMSGRFWLKVEPVLALLRLFQDLQYFPNSFTIGQLQKSNIKSLVKVHSPLHLSIQARKSEDLKMEEVGTSDSLSNPTRSQLIMLKLRPKCPTDIPSMDYIEMSLKAWEEKCYLSQKFDQSIISKYDNHIPSYCLSEMLKRGGEYRISNDNQLIYINEGMLRGQKDTLKFVIKQIGANLISGKSVLNVSLPVDIFEPRALLERSASSLGMAPDYLIPVADADPLTQIKNVATFIATIPTLQLQMQKPFNPILGQTFQAYIKGIPIYYEQISHHPPISAYYMTCPEFTMHGNLIAFADVSINSAVGGNEGVMHIHMRNGSHFQCYFPPCEIAGLIFGNRTFRAYAKGYIFETKSKLFAEMSIEKHKKGLYEKGNDKLTPGDLIGGVFKVREEFMERIRKESSLRKFSGLSKKDVESKLADIRGVWFKSISIGGEEVSANKRVYPLQYPEVVLPSDSNFRWDILYHKVDNYPESQRMKEVLEVKQRADRKLREKQQKARRKQ